MPYKGPNDPKIPSYVPKKYRKLWVSAFNAAYHSSNGDEAYAFKVANAAVKKAKKKSKNKESLVFPKGTKFATEKETEKFSYIIEKYLNETKEDPVLSDYTVPSELLISLAEAKINKESRTADIIALQKGWSYNGNYYNKEVAESLADHLRKRKKIYLNHVEEKDKKLGRNLRDWVATIEESYGNDGKTYAKISFTTSEAGEFIFQEALKHPEEIQFSIDALARAREGKAEGRSGTIIEKFVFLDSLDVVDYASAGGQLLRAYASKRNSELNSLIEVSNMLKDAVVKKKIRAELEILMTTFINLLYKISWSYEEETDETKKEQIESLVKEFIDEFNKLDLVKAFESKNKNKEGEEIMEITLEMLKKENPEILESFKKELEADGTLKDLESKVSDLEAEVTALKDDVSAKETTISEKEKALEDKEKELKEAKEQLEKYILAEKTKAKEEKIEGFLKESKLGDLNSMPETIKEVLLSKESDEDIKNYIESLESFIKDKGVISGAGKTTGDVRTTESEKKALSDEEVAKLING